MIRSEDKDELQRYGAEPWQVQLLALNPSYVHWGPHEDYMWKEGQGWDVPVKHASWSEGRLGLDELNEVVNFYFAVNRDSEKCKVCGGNGTHPDAQWITESFYSHSSPFKRQTEYEESIRSFLKRFGMEARPPIMGYGAWPPIELLNRYGKAFAEFCVRTMERGGYWFDDITEDEAAELVARGRDKIDGLVTAADFNAANVPGVRIGHDAINRWILCDQRCKRLGVPSKCTNCDGHGYLWSSDRCRTVLTLWVLHPRKGCSRGWEITDVRQEDLSEIFRFLREAAQRNAERFSKIPEAR